MTKRSREGKEKEVVRIIEGTRVLAARFFFCVQDHRLH